MVRKRKLFTRSNLRKRGYTLIELVVAISIFSIVSLLTFNIWQSVRNTNKVQREITHERVGRNQALTYVQDAYIRGSGNYELEEYRIEETDAGSIEYVVYRDIDKDEIMIEYKYNIDTNELIIDDKISTHQLKEFSFETFETTARMQYIDSHGKFLSKEIGINH